MNDKAEIDSELSRLIAVRTKFFQKSNPTPAEIEEFEQAGKRIQELFVVLAQYQAA